jgi:2-oxoglutarate dehydrogenase E2 component (dihydrolipoamide succinyltransferase)
MARVELIMPQMGESITEGTVIVWHKQVGDVVELDETVLEIGTDKVDTEVPSPSAGKIAKILVAEGTVVEVGTPLALIETDVAATINETVETSAPSTASPEPQVAAVTPPPPSDPVAVQNATPAPTSAPGARTTVVMPQMGESITEGTVITWHKKVGDAIEVDETLLEVATDKVDTEVPSPAAGTVLQILVPEGETVDVGTALAIVGEGAAIESTPSAPRPNTPSPVQAPSAPPVADKASVIPSDSAVERAAVGSVPRHSDDGRFLSPLVRSIAQTEGISTADLAQIVGSGRQGRVTKDDLLAFIANRPHRAPQEQTSAASPSSSTPSPIFSQPAAPVSAPSGDRVEIIQMDRMRQIIAEHMVRSKATSAHVTSFAEVDVTKLVDLVKRNKGAFLNREGVKLTFTPFFVYAAVSALKDHPILNASVDEKAIKMHKDIHIGIAVALGKTGLIAPVIRNAGQHNISGLAHAASDLADRARSKKLQPDDLQGGTFTVTNIGSLGSLMGTPIINQPQVGILATGAIKKRPVVVEDPVYGDMITIRSMMYVSLSYDHRIIDGAMGASFLRAFTNAIESIDPNTPI